MTELTARLGGPEAITAGIVAEFQKMCAVPHPSHGERAVGRLLARRLEALGGVPVMDAAGNLTADLPAAPGCGGAPLTILQGHMDMVCAVRPGSGYEPERDPIRAEAADGFLRSDGRSSLGADNGLGNAAVLWLLGQKLERGPVRVIFTVAEEVGLAGAREVDPSWLAGARYLLNTDGFHLGTAVVGSAGGRRETFSRPLATCPAGAGQAFSVSLSGFSGGHSGDDIHRGRGNPVKALTALLSALPFPWALADFSGGQAHNAIPTWAAAVVTLSPAHVPALKAAFADWAAALEAAHRASDPNFRAALEETALPEQAWDNACRDALLALTGGLTHGVQRWHADFPGVVSASANLGRVWTEDGTIKAAEFIRCADPADEAAMAGAHRRLAEASGFAAAATGYPAWQGRPDNPLALLMDRVFRREAGRGMEISAVHVGLEPSFFQAKAPEVVMAVSGPDILDAHSPDERAPLSSLPVYAALLAGTLEEIGHQQG